MSDVSVVVLTWNARDLVAECLEHLQAALASSPLDCEIWVVDNGSQDGTVDALQPRFPAVQWLALPENLGFAAGMNAGLRKASGRSVVLLNNDTRVPAGALEQCVQFLAEHPDVGIVGPQLLAPDGSKQNSVHVAPSLVTELAPKWLLEWLFPKRFPSKRQIGPEPVDVEAVLGACLCVRREVIESVGALPEEYFFFLEETDWCWRVRRAGWRVVHLPTVTVTHLLGQTSKKRDPGSTRIEYHRSLYRFFARNRGSLQRGLVVGVRFLKSLLYTLLPTPAVLWSPRARSRWASRRAVFAWHLAGCPASRGLQRLEG